MDDKTYQVLYSTSLGYALYSLDNQISLHKSRGKLFFKDKKILIGDYVKLDESGLIYQIVDRKSSLSRPRLANPDLVLVLISAKQPDFSTYLLDKFLSLVNFSNIDAAIVVTKADLLSDNELKTIKERLKYYNKIDYKTFLVDTHNRETFDFNELTTLISSKKVALMGQTGVGKSSLLNLISSNLKRKVDSLHVSSGRGRHTTKEVILLPYENGFLYDTPGFSELDLIELKPKDIAIYFPGFKKLFSSCKFNDCMHLGHEKDCAILKALKDDELSLDSYQNYCKIYEEVKANDIWKKKI